MVSRETANATPLPNRLGEKNPNLREKETMAEESGAGFYEQFETRMKTIQEQWEAQRKAIADVIEQRWEAQRKAIADLLEQQHQWSAKARDQWEAQRKAIADQVEQRWEVQRKAIADLVEREWNAQKNVIEELFRRKPE